MKSQYWPKQPKEILLLLTLLILCVFFIMAYGTYRCRTPGFEDPFTRSIIDRYPWNRYIDGWGLLHFWFYATLTFYFPTRWIEIIIAGFLWEILEMFFKERPFYLAECNVQVQQEKEGWWYGRWEDLVMNALGVLFGLWVHSRNAPPKVFPAMFVGIIIIQCAMQYLK